jgi:hypothetical protein
MSNLVTGQISSYCQYRHMQKDSSAIIDEVGKIDYELSLGSGTGIAQINRVWYSDRTVNTTDSLNLFNLTFERFGYDLTQSFYGPASGNIKGVKIENSSSADIGVHLPFDGFNGQFIVPPSGSVVMSNARGWEIASTGAVVQVSGNGTNQRYNISIVGAALPIILNAGQVIPIEYKVSSVFDNIVNFEVRNQFDSSSSNIIPFEFLASAPSGSAVGTIPIEYQDGLSFSGLGGTGIPFENRGSVSYGYDLPVEWYVGTGDPEYIHNNTFLVNGSGLEHNFFNGLPDPSSIPPWELIWPTGVVVQAPTYSPFNGAMHTLKCEDFYGIWRLGLVKESGYYAANYMLLGLSSVYARHAHSIRQTVYVESGGTYRIRWMNNNSTWDWEWTYGTPGFTAKSRSGVTLASMTPQNTSVDYQTSLDITAIDDVIVLEWSVPDRFADNITGPDRSQVSSRLFQWFIGGNPTINNPGITMRRIS